MTAIRSVASRLTFVLVVAAIAVAACGDDEMEQERLNKYCFDHYFSEGTLMPTECSDWHEDFRARQK